jgi:FAD/FMN-containing dehydrogenase/Fe-S oxidoreductase
VNAPLPLKVAREAPHSGYDEVARATQNEVAAKLAQRLAQETRGEVLFSPADRGRYSTDASIYQVMPIGVFVPRSADEARIAIDVCRDLNVPIVARGAGTSQCGQTVGTGLVVDFSKHVRSLLDFDAGKATATVEPGIVLDSLNAQLKKHGLWYPVDVSTSAQATLGGMAGNNSCGSRSIAYGNMVHNVLAVEAWTSDGAHHRFERYEQCAGAAREIGRKVKDLASLLAPEIDRRWPKVMRRVGGYNLDIFRNQSERPYTGDGGVNLAHLLVGSEGTLALTSSLTLQLAPLPRAKVLGVVNFPTFYKAMDSAQHIVKLDGGDGSLTAVELVDRTMIELALQNPAFATTVKASLIGRPDALLLVEFSGADRQALARKLAQLEELMGDLGLARSVVHLVDEMSQKNLWEVRKAGLNIMMSLKGDGKPVSFIEDCAVPLANLAEYTDSLTQVFRRHGTRGTWYAHASVGTLHVRPILDMRKDGAKKMRAIAEEASALVRRYKGAYSGEHGDGLCRGEWIAWQFGPKIAEGFAQIKQLFDPIGLFAPRRIVDPQRMDDTRLMRFAPSYRVIPLKTALDWSVWDVQNDAATERTTPPGTGGDPAQGFAKAVEMCNNNGHCRKFDAGTMCPSYRVTRDERHLTRGRANTLRLALSGRLGPEGLASDAVRDALDLCVSCKGCRRECPTGVDMARMKIESLHQDRSRNGWSAKDRLVGSLPDYAAFASRFAGLLNLRNRSRVLARIGQALFGFAKERSLPEWRARHFFNGQARFASRDEVLSAKNPVVLFVDTFNGFFESGNAFAALRVLRAAGYTVHVASKEDGGAHLCCGRTYLASGMVERARAKVGDLVDALHVFAQRSIPIVGLEPACLFTLRDEALALGLGPRAQEVAKQALLFEEFLAREAAAGRLDVLRGRLAPPAKPVLVHGHCHQKAFGAVSPVLEVLKLIPGVQPQLIDSGCCGMAGSFGYEASHMEVSTAMAEQSLFPALRANPGAIVVADGTSCRHQIRDGLGREAMHAAALLASALKD